MNIPYEYLKDSLLEKYLLNDKNNNYLAVKILESKFQICFLYQGIHRILLILKYDLEDLLNSSNFDIKKINSIIKYLPGIKQSINCVSNFINDIISILENIINDKNPQSIPIDFIEDIENKIIESILRNFMGKELNKLNNKNYISSKKLLKIILIYIFHKFVSPWGIIIHDKIVFDEDVKHALIKIIEFYLCHTFLKKFKSSLSSILFKIPYTNKFSIKGFNVENLINEFVENFNKEIDNFKKCKKKTKKYNYNCKNQNFNFCKKNNEKLCKNILKNVKQKSKKKWSILDINCNSNDIFDKSIIKQAQKGSIIANIIIFSEFYLSKENQNSMDLLDFFEFKGQNSSFKNLLLNYLKYNYLETFDQINTLLIIIYRAGFINIIDDLMKNWGLVSPCIEQKLKENLLPPLNLHNYIINKNHNSIKKYGNLDLVINENPKNYAFFCILDYRYNFYYSYNLISYKIEEEIDKELKYKIFASLNITYISYSTFIYHINTETFNIIIKNLIKHNDEIYFILIEIPKNYIYSRLISYFYKKNNNYYVKTDYHNDFMFEYKKILKKNNLSLYLIPYVFINEELNILKKIKNNNRWYLKKLYHKTFNKKKHSSFNKLQLTLSMDNDEKEFVVPNSSFLEINGIKYSVLSKIENNSHNGGFKNKKIYELINFCKKNKIKKYSNLKKEELIKLIKKNNIKYKINKK